MEYKKRNNCRLCKSKKLTHFLDLKKIPIGESLHSSKLKASRERNYPLTVSFCKKCKHVQTLDVVDTSKLWIQYTYLSGQTRAIVNHFKDFSRSISNKYDFINNSFVVDVGSNDGTLLKQFKKINCKVLGIDPSKNVSELANKNGIETINNFINKDVINKILLQYGKAKLITAFNVFAHSDNMDEMMLCIKKLLDRDGIFAFECQYLGDILKRKILGTFFHEHLSHHSVYSLNLFFKKHKMRIVDINSVNVQKGSIIGLVCHEKSFLKSKKTVSKYLHKEKYNNLNTLKTLSSINKYVLLSKQKISKLIYNRKLIAYGCARSGPTLAYNLGLDKKFEIILDNHPFKQGKYTPLNSSKIIKSKEIFKYKDHLIVILAYLHNKKIITKHKKFIDQGGEFLILYPSPKIINSKSIKKFEKN